MLNGNISSIRLYNMVNFGPLTVETCWRVWWPQQISTSFVSWLRYCSDVAHRRATKHCTIIGRLLGWYVIYTISGALAPWRNFARCKIHFTSKSCVLLYWQRYCTAFEQRPSAKLCGMLQGMESRNFSQRSPPIFGWAAITLGIGRHSSPFFFFFFSFRRIISAAADWMSAILPHTVWP